MTTAQTAPDLPAQAAGPGAVAEHPSPPTPPSSRKKKSSGGARKASASSEGARFKSFGLGVRVDDLPPVEFELCGTVFHCRRAIQSKKLLDLIRGSGSSDGLDAGTAVYSFMEQAILPEDIDAWRALLDSDEYVIDISMLSEIVTWLVVTYSDRPTTQ